MSTKLPAIPGVNHLGTELQRVLIPIKEILEVGLGRRGADNAFLTDGTAAAAIQRNIDSGAVTLPSTTPITPTTPTGLTAQGAIASIILAWDAPGYTGHAYTEIWRAASDDLGVAVRVGMTPGEVWGDPVGSVSDTYYYWIRFVSTSDDEGPYNAGVNAGTVATTTPVAKTDLADTLSPPEIVATLPTAGTQGRIVFLTTDNKLYRDTGAEWTTKIFGADIDADAITDVHILDGAVVAGKIAADAVTAGTIEAAAVSTNELAAGAITVGSGIIANLAVENAQLGLLAVDTGNIKDLAVVDAKVSNLSAGKITTGTLDANRIAVNSLNGNKIVAGTINADRLVANSITSGYIAAGAITAAGGEIADLAVTTLKLAGQAVTIPVSAVQGAGVAMSSAWQTLASTSFTGTGAPIFTTGSAYFVNTSSVDEEYVELRILVAGSQTAFGVSLAAINGGYTSICVTGKHSGYGAGVTVYLQAREPAGVGVNTAYSGSVYAQETKK